MPRFAILKHDWPFPHYDLMLESGDSLRTWRLKALWEEHEPFLAEELQNHRLAYLDYEGPLSNERGSVKRVDCRLVRMGSRPAEASIRSDEWNSTVNTGSDCGTTNGNIGCSAFHGSLVLAECRYSPFIDSIAFSGAPSVDFPSIVTRPD